MLPESGRITWIGWDKYSSPSGVLTLAPGSRPDQMSKNRGICVLVLSGFPPVRFPSHPPLAARAASQLYDVQNLDPSDDDHLRVDDPGQRAVVV